MANDTPTPAEILKSLHMAVLETQKWIDETAPKLKAEKAKVIKAKNFISKMSKVWDLTDPFTMPKVVYKGNTRPAGITVEEGAEDVCPVCGFKAKSHAGLMIHQGWKHRGD